MQIFYYYDRKKKLWKKSYINYRPRIEIAIRLMDREKKKKKGTVVVLIHVTERLSRKGLIIGRATFNLSNPVFFVPFRFFLPLFTPTFVPGTALGYRVADLRGYDKYWSSAKRC